MTMTQRQWGGKLRPNFDLSHHHKMLGRVTPQYVCEFLVRPRIQPLVYSWQEAAVLSGKLRGPLKK